MIIYGRNPVREALRGRRGVKRIWATESAAREPWLQATRAPRSPAAAAQLEAICGSADHQGVCAKVEPFPYTAADRLLALPEPMIVALDQIQDPQNLGSICRTAECAGVAGVVIPDRRAAEITPAVCKASAGAVEHLPVAMVRNVADFLDQAKRAGAWCYGAAADSSATYDTVDYSGALVLVLGSEGKGLRPRVAAACDALVSLPLKGRIGSLGVSAAAAALLYHAARSRA